MKKTNIFIGIIVIVFILSIIFFINDAVKNSGASNNTKEPAENIIAAGIPTEKLKKHPHIVIAYYFHTTHRCPSCLKIEELSFKAIKNGFVENLKKGDLICQSINVDEPENEHFIKDYKLFTKSLIIVDIKNTKQIRWKNLEKVWALLGDEKTFVDYVQKEVKMYLEGK